MMNCVRNGLLVLRIIGLNASKSNSPRQLCLLCAKETDKKVLSSESTLILKRQFMFLNVPSSTLCRYYSGKVINDTEELPKSGIHRDIKQVRENTDSHTFANNQSKIINGTPTLTYSDSCDDQTLRHYEATANQSSENSDKLINYPEAFKNTQSDSSTDSTISRKLHENTLNENAHTHNHKDRILTEYSMENESIQVFDKDLPNDLPLSEREGDWSREMLWVASQETKDVLSPPKHATEVDVYAPELRPSFNFAAYINKSPTLQQMVKLGVDLSQWEKRRDVGSYILRLDFEADMKQYITFLHDKGVPAEDLGHWLTVNPFIFKEQLEDLEARVNYLEVMGFTPAQVTRIITRNPYWLLRSTVKIDSRLGFFQRTFELTGSEVRALATKQPRLITARFMDVKKTCFTVLEEMGFTASEMKSLLLSKPKLWLASGVHLMRRFDFAHNVMGLSHDQLVQFPHVLISREFRLRQRHSYLKSIGRAQYNPTLPGYVSPQQLVTGDDVFFCTQVAKTAVQDFNDFLKTL